VGTPYGIRQCRAWQPGPIPLPWPRKSGGTAEAPAPGNRALHWGAGDWPGCGVSGAGADSPGGLKLGPGRWAGYPESCGCPQGLDNPFLSHCFLKLLIFKYILNC